MIGRTQIRQVETAQGVVVYTLERKQIHNLNLRIKRDATVWVSVPVRTSIERVEAFVLSKADWIFEHRSRMEQYAQIDLPPEPDRQECLRLLQQAVNDIYPLVAPLGVAMPKLKIRRMTSQWGNCHWKQGYITLNVALARCSKELRRYVALHELVHFLEPNHGEGFYYYMDRLMPEWKCRRSELKKLSGILRDCKE